MNDWLKGLITISGTWALVDSLAMVTTTAAMSAGLRILARCSADTGLGRCSRMGVSTSPGKIVVMRMPLFFSSSLALVQDVAGPLELKDLAFLPLENLWHLLFSEIDWRED